MSKDDENLVDPEVLKKINQDLEKEILGLGNKISNLEKQNEILLQNLEKVKSSEEVVSNLQNEIVQLNIKISDLEEDNTILVERNKNLNVEELEKSSLQDKIKDQVFNWEDKGTKKPAFDAFTKLTKGYSNLSKTFTLLKFFR